jgi:type I restriction enzyme S subunit
MGSGLRQSLTFADVKRLPLLIPPPDEQEAIVEYLDREIKKIDDLIKQQLIAVDLLRERKGAIVASAVTGQIDVRQFEMDKV